MSYAVDSSSRASHLLSDCPLLPVDTTYSLNFRRKVLKQLHLSLYFSGISALYGWTQSRIQRKNAAIVLMYHSVPEASAARWIDPCNRLSPVAFERQMKYLASHRYVISIDRLVQQLEQGEPIQPGTVAITFDDGYLDNLTVAAPILAKYDLPATIYLPTNYIAAGENQWIDALYATFRSRSKHDLSLPELGRWQLNHPSVIKQAYHHIALHLVKETYPRRQEWLAKIDKQLAPAASPPRLTMTWADIQQLQQQYPNITLGVHTASHLDLSTHADKIEDEMTQSIHQLTAVTGDRPQHFAFPYNRYSLEAQKRVAKYMRSAIAITPDRVVRDDTSPHELTRLEAPKSFTMLKSWVDSGFPSLSQKLLGYSWTCPY